MDMDSYTRFALSLVFVIGLIFVVAALLRRFGVAGTPLGAGNRGRRRIAIVESAMVDGRRRLLLVRRDDREHLLLVGGTTDLTIERNIRGPASPDPPATPGDTVATPSPPSSPSFRTLLAREQEKPQ